jgi:hypothetical protein
MPPLKTHGITRETVDRFIVDAGAVYVNLGEVDERPIGATRGGNSFTIEQDVRVIEMDGAKGEVKGARRVVEVHVRLTANLLEMTAENFRLALAGTTAAPYPDATAKTHDSLTRSRDIIDADYIKNIALVGKISGSDENIICICKNALADGNLELGTEDKEESTLEIQFTGHFDPEFLDVEPWEIRFPNAGVVV